MLMVLFIVMAIAVISSGFIARRMPNWPAGETIAFVMKPIIWPGQAWNMPGHWSSALKILTFRYMVRRRTASLRQAAGCTMI